MNKNVWLVLFMALWSAVSVAEIHAQDRNSSPVDAPDFILTELGGDTITLSDLKGKVVLLNFWATWCGPCKEEIPHFNEAYVQYKDRGLYILGVSIDRGENLVRRFLAKKEIKYPLAMSTPQLYKDYQPGGVVPVTFIIDKKGKIRQKHIAYLDKKTLEKYIAELL